MATRKKAARAEPESADPPVDDEETPQQGLDENERADVEEHRDPSTLAVYEIIRIRGVEELKRPAASLWWAGVAAGLAISFSVFVEAYLHMLLPDAPWRPLVANFGYCFGFVMVLLGGFQLFTESTITAILPLLAEKTRSNLIRTAQFWAIVFLANLAGTFVAALMVTQLGFASEAQLAAILEVAREFSEKPPLKTMLGCVMSGFLIAALVWIMPKSVGNEFWVILAVTYVIALGDFSHVITGSSDVFLLVLSGELSVFEAIFNDIAPAFIGNVIGGSLLFSLIAYGQVREEM